MTRWGIILLAAAALWLGCVGLGGRLAGANPQPATTLSAALSSAALSSAAPHVHLHSSAAAPADPDQIDPDQIGHSHGPSGHAADEGLLLAAQADVEEDAAVGGRCPADAPLRAFDLLAIQVEITLNRYLDYDPEGRMYLLADDLGRVRAEEAQNQAARREQAEPAVTVGLQGDAIQPLILRVHQGDCLRVTLHNQLPAAEAASFHLHGAGLIIAASGAAAIATNPDSTVQPGGEVTVEWWVRPDQPEGTHYFHSHGDTREQTSHGLFGAVIVEKAGTRFLDPLSGQDLRSGWSAIIEDANGSDFREFALVYHEIGNERYRHLDGKGRPVAQVDPYTGAYRPGDRALNYRSEPFMNRMQLQQERAGRFDESLAYNSYAFGDPATPLARSYLGDPVKERVIHGGSEVFHVHHVHGGSIRWRRQADVEPTYFDAGLVKQPLLVPLASERLDSQAVGPSETYDVAHECGSGGCQQSAGDYLVHCHVAHHYFAGMWMIWRVYNTLQDGPVSQDTLPPLRELPDRAGHLQPAVTSAGLLAQTVLWQGKPVTLTSANLAQWVEQQLPPAGQPIGYDASVFDWQRSGDLYLNEPETADAWPGYDAATPDQRPPLYFDRVTGKLAYPFLRPHLGKRPPFAPKHGPAPFLDPAANGADLPLPGASGAASLCPQGTQAKDFAIEAIDLSIPLHPSARAGKPLTDPSGQLFVLQEQAAALRAHSAAPTPLVIRANAGQECVDVVLKSSLQDQRENAFFSKVSLHIHFVQFDIQASDGVNTGFNYEQTVRPYTVEGETIQSPVAAGADRLLLSSVERFQKGVLVGVGMEQSDHFEIRRIEQITGDSLIFSEPLRFDHSAGETVSVEFVRYRWYPDAQTGTAYFHDHVNALNSWRHGLFGALIVEPPGSTYHDPYSAQPLTSGAVAAIHTEARLSPDISGSFRELVLLLQDDNPRTQIGDASGGSINLRVEPLAARGGASGGAPDELFRSQRHGDPATPLLESYLGDPLVIRSLVAGANDMHTLHVDGHWFRLEPYSLTSPPINTAQIGISERMDLMIAQAGGPQQMPGDYLYYNGRASKLAEGNWGLIRVYAGDAQTTLRRLPGHARAPVPAASLCPQEAPRRRFAVAAVETPLPMLAAQKVSAPQVRGQRATVAPGKVYLLQSEKAAVLAGAQAAAPLVLHANVGDCLEIELTNELAQGSVSFHADLLAVDPNASLGVAAGFNAQQVVAVGESRVVTYFAHPDIGETVALVRDWGDVLTNPRLGMYGAIVIGPPGATYSDPQTGADAGLTSTWRVDVHPAQGPSYRDFTLLLEDEDGVIGSHLMPYAEEVAGIVGLNYQMEPLTGALSVRRKRNPEPSLLFRSTTHGDPATPLLEAVAGDPVRIHVLVAYGEQAHVFTVEGHEWLREPGRAGSDRLSSVQVGPLASVTMLLTAGGADALPGDYLYGDHREPYRAAGLWGLFRVYAPGASGDRLMPLR